MSITLYALCGQDDRRFSPFCWRTKYALAHKGLAFETVPVSFSAIKTIGDGSFKTVPVIEDNGTWVGDSWEIAKYLAKAYPDAPALFPSPEVEALCHFVETWQFSNVLRQAFPAYVHDIYLHVKEEDRTYFKESREKQLGGTKLESLVETREEKLPGLRSALFPLRMTLGNQRWLSGDTPGYADYLILSTFLWLGSVATLPVLEKDDPLLVWLEKGRDLYDGLGRTSPCNEIAA